MARSVRLSSSPFGGSAKMKVLAVNCGSSTLKFQLIMVEGKDTVPGQMRRLAHGIVDRIGSHGAIEFTTENGEGPREVAAITVNKTLGQWLEEAIVEKIKREQESGKEAEK